MLSGKNFEVKYKEFKDGDLYQNIRWMQSDWTIFMNYKVDYAEQAVRLAVEELKDQGLIL